MSPQVRKIVAQTRLSRAQEQRERAQREARQQATHAIRKDASRPFTRSTTRARLAANIARGELTARMKGRVGWEVVSLSGHDGMGGERIAMISGKSVVLLTADATGRIRDGVGRVLHVPEAIRLAVNGD
jgi:hypothetical protein